MAVKSLSYLLDRLKLGFRSEICAICHVRPVNRQNQLICSFCEREIMLKQPLPVIMLPNASIYAACGFSYKTKQLIYGLKFGKKAQYGATVSEIMIHYWQQLSQAQDKKWIVVPIPSHESSRFPHVALMARPFASHFGYDFAEDALIWKRPTRLQHTILNRRKRFENMAGAFEVNPHFVKRLKAGQKILLLDDLLTTGATLIEAVSAMQRARSEVSICAMATSYVPLAVSRSRLKQM